MNTLGFPTNGIDPTFDYLVFLFGPSRQNKDFSSTHDYKDFEEMKADYKLRGTFTVNTANSESTIFAAPFYNHCFRYWHDLCHIQADAPFTADGERLASYRQMDMVWQLQGPTDADKARWCALIDCEVNGQTEYYMEHGFFPSDQRAFALDFLKKRDVDVSKFPRDVSQVTIEF